MISYQEDAKILGHMTLEAKTAKIWSFPVDGSHPAVQPFTLVELMHGIPNHPNYLVQHGSCLVIGVQSMPINTQEFDKLVEKEVDDSFQAYKREHPETEITDEHIERATLLLRENYSMRHRTHFRTFRYVDRDGKSMADGMPYQGILTDAKWLGILYFDTQQITVLPYGNPREGPHKNLFYDARAKIADSRWEYTGNLETALSEFHQRGFTFNVARLPSNLDDHMQLMRGFSNAPANRRINGMMTDTNLPLEQVLAIIANPPV